MPSKFSFSGVRQVLHQPLWDVRMIPPEPTSMDIKFFDGSPPADAPPIFQTAGSSRVWTLRDPIIAVIHGYDVKVDPMPGELETEEFKKTRSFFRPNATLKVVVGQTEFFTGSLHVLPFPTKTPITIPSFQLYFARIVPGAALGVSEAPPLPFLRTGLLLTAKLDTEIGCEVR